jgi:hypothetical protein
MRGEIKASTKVTGKRYWLSVEAAQRQVRDGEFYFIRRHGYLFRPGANGYCHKLANAGVFSAEQARSYLSVEGLSVIPVSGMREELLEHLAESTAAVNALRNLLTAPGKLVTVRPVAPAAEPDHLPALEA